MSIDLGGIGKGYAIDRASDVLKRNGLTSFLFNAGGDVLVSGYKAEDQNWTVGIKDPRKEDKLLGSVELTNKSIATSGDYERYFEIDGKRYHHIIDPIHRLSCIQFCKCFDYR
jgi:thiamine biosynthesis lipoprotein